MQQLFFNNVSTQFVTNPDDPDGPQIAQQVGTFRNDSALAGAIGIPALNEEKSDNYSVGIVLNLLDGLSVTLDYYVIDIEDRIVISNLLERGLADPLTDALISVGAGAGQFFLNGADTETEGVDLVATYNGIELFGGYVDLTLAANFTETEVVDLFTPAGSGLATLSTDQVFSSRDISIIEEWQPEDRITFSGIWRGESLSVNLALNRYGEYTVTDGGSQTYGAELLTDISARYEIGNGFSIRIGGNNIFDVTPDKNTIGNSRTGAIEDANGNIIVDSAGVFRFSRRAAPFGFNGAYYYAGVNYAF